MPTALITGASSGIGATFARRLAARGHNLILVARREERLRALAAELEQQHRITAEVLVADLSAPDGLERVENRIAELDSLDMLINNAGFGALDKFAEIDVRKALAMIQVHVVAPVRLTRATLPGMIARGRGAIINVSSLAAFFPMRGNTTYCATKAYLNAFSLALEAELRGAGVQVQALCPGFTYTEFHDSPEFEDFDRSQIPKTFWMSAERVVTASLNALGKNRVISIPGVKNRLLALLARSGLASLLLKILARLRK